MTKEEAIRILSTRDSHGMVTGYAGGIKEAIDMGLEALEQELKTGHWEYGYAFPDGNYCKCSECKEIIRCIYPMHYCPNCGSKMIGERKKNENKEL